MFHRYIHGRHFKLLTDHKPLLAIFGSRKGVPVYTANRLQRWALLLKNYDFTIEYTSTSNFGQADALSRLIAEEVTSEEDIVIATIEQDAAAILTMASSKLPVNAKRIAEETSTDPILKQVLYHVKTRLWPKKPDRLLSRYNSLCGSLSTQEGCVFVGDRIVIPDRLRTVVLQQLYDGHPGMTKMKMLARSYVYWTNINEDIENSVRNCARCQENAKNPVKVTLHSWPTDEKPWTRVHADFAGPIEGKMYLVVVDAYSKWPEIIDMPSSTTSATIKEFHRLFAQFGNPETLVTDNGPQFTSKEMEDFCVQNGIRHLKSPPFHPQSNGQAERFVDTFKRTIQKLRNELSTHEALQRFLLTYRRTPCPSAPRGASPAEAFLGRTTRTKLSLLKPSTTSEKNSRNKKMEKQFNRYHRARQKEFSIGDFVWARDYRRRSPTQSPGIVLHRRGTRLYDVVVGDEVWRRHASQLRARHVNTTTSNMELADLPLLPSSAAEEVAVPSTSKNGMTAPKPNSSALPTLTNSDDSITETQRQRIPRIRRPPQRLQIDTSKKSYT